MTLLKELNESARKEDLDDYMDSVMDEFRAGKISYNQAFENIKNLARSNPAHDFDYWIIMLDTEADIRDSKESGRSHDALGRAIRHKEH